MSTNTLPNTRTLITTLVSSIQSPEQVSTTVNPLKNVSTNTKNALQTLHVLYPNEFLPALDLLDRHLLTRLAFQNSDTGVYYVRSSQEPRNSYNNANRSYDGLTTYNEVRTLAWNCSCPAFAFAAFPAEEGDAVENSWEDTGPSVKGQWRFGGLGRGADMPVCKHLLACVLAERCGLFGRHIEERDVAIEEIAGWAAGWGG